MVVVLVFGIPGCGKTSFVKKFQDFCETSGTRCSRVSFDDFSTDKVWDEGSFQAIREASLKAVSSTVPDLMLRNVEELPPDLQVTIVDDIMHLRSMRREVYVIARDRGVPVVAVWINTDFETALARNRLRTGREKIDEDAIWKIHSTLQPPDPAHIFDRNAVTVDGNVADMGRESMAGILELAKKLWEEAVAAAANKAAAATAQSIAASAQQRESFLKELDVALRNVVAEGMSINKQLGVDGVDSRALGKAFAAAKPEVLSTARHHCGKETARDKGTVIKDYCHQFISLVLQSTSPHSPLPERFSEQLIAFVDTLRSAKMSK